MSRKHIASLVGRPRKLDPSDVYGKERQIFPSVASSLLRSTVQYIIRVQKDKKLNNATKQSTELDRFLQTYLNRKVAFFEQSRLILLCDILRFYHPFVSTIILLLVNEHRICNMIKLVTNDAQTSLLCRP